MKIEGPRAHSIRQLRALGATAMEYYRVTRDFPFEWDHKLHYPVDPGATAESTWINYLQDQGRLG